MEHLEQKWLFLAEKFTRSEWTPACVQQQFNLVRIGIRRGYVNEEHALAKLTSWYMHELKLYLNRDEVSLISNDIKMITKDEKKNYFFITVGLDDKIITIKGIKECLEKLVQIKNMECLGKVAEKHRCDENGKPYIHHHIHVLYRTDYSKSKAIQYVFQKVKKWVAGKNFVDCKNNQPIENYIKYISGDKQVDKRECVEKDDLWRKQNNI